MTTTTAARCDLTGRFCGMVVGLFLVTGIQTDLYALPLQIEVRDPNGNPVSVFRWLLEEDNTNQPLPGALVSDSLAVDIHKSHAPVVDEGRTAGSVASIEVPGDQPYFVDVHALAASDELAVRGSIGLGKGEDGEYDAC